MRFLQRNFLAFVAAVFLLSATNAAAAEYKIRWLLAHDPIKAFDNAITYFKNTVEKETDGAVVVEPITVMELNKGQPMSESQVYDGLKRGEFEMCQTYGTFLGSKSPKFWAFDLPFLFRDYQHAEKVITGSIGKEILASLQKENIEGLAITYSGGFRVIPTVNKKISRLEDFQGVHVRIPSYSSVAAAMYEGFGSIPMPMNPEAGNQAQMSGQIEGLETTLPRFWELKNRDTSRVVNNMEHSLYVTSLALNKTFADKLPAKYRKIIQKAAEEAAAMERRDAIALGESLKKEMASQGFTLVNPTHAEKLRLQKASASVYANFEAIIGKDLIARIRALK